jgi:hypothetical protein
MSLSSPRLAVITPIWSRLTHTLLIRCCRERTNHSVRKNIFHGTDIANLPRLTAAPF